VAHGTGSLEIEQQLEVVGAKEDHILHSVCNPFFAYDIFTSEFASNLRIYSMILWLLFVDRYDIVQEPKASHHYKAD
jgi:hypothetical protein